MNLPNKLTIFRIILVPIMVIIPFLGIDEKCMGIPVQWLIIDLIFVIASIGAACKGDFSGVAAIGKFVGVIALLICVGLLFCYPLLAIIVGAVVATIVICSSSK